MHTTLYITSCRSYFKKGRENLVKKWLASTLPTAYASLKIKTFYYARSYVCGIQDVNGKKKLMHIMYHTRHFTHVTYTALNGWFNECSNI